MANRFQTGADYNLIHRSTIPMSAQGAHIHSLLFAFASPCLNHHGQRSLPRPCPDPPSPPPTACIGGLWMGSFLSCLVSHAGLTACFPCPASASPSRPTARVAAGGNVSPHADCSASYRSSMLRCRICSAFASREENPSGVPSIRCVKSVGKFPSVSDRPVPHPPARPPSARPPSARPPPAPPATRPSAAANTDTAAADTAASDAGAPPSAGVSTDLAASN